ncbi:MAG: hypothetical protein DWQ36_17605 [Acidobacteria bacterium]|nr:MAG: hypothetical protein DWQ30_15945 [Acidobacteriota bacterium]REK04257.1 MAG: hypothetical protein DWQ36_17605 [Acidobacteriota bacterium]
MRGTLQSKARREGALRRLVVASWLAVLPLAPVAPQWVASRACCVGEVCEDGLCPIERGRRAPEPAMPSCHAAAPQADAAGQHRGDAGLRPPTQTCIEDLALAAPALSTAAVAAAVSSRLTAPQGLLAAASGTPRQASRGPLGARGPPRG